MGTCSRPVLVLIAMAGLILATNGCADQQPPPVPTAGGACQPWTEWPRDLHSNLDSPYLGCSNAMNLRAMLVDPADLDRGRPLGPTDGAAAARAVGAYRRGAVKPTGAAETAIPTQQATPAATGGGL